MANNKLIVQHRRGTAEQWESSGIVPYDGEIVVHECADGTFKTKLGMALIPSPICHIKI